MKDIIRKTILTCSLFIIMQTIIGLIIAVPLSLINGANKEDPTLTHPGFIAVSLILADILSIWSIHKLLGTIRFKESFARHKKMTNRRALAMILGTFAFVVGTFGIDLLNEQLDLTDQLEDMFFELSHNWIGILCLAVLGPITEELIFREGIAGYWLRNGAKPWIAIVVSSFIFGVIHMNPVQIFSAFAIGLLLGTIYWKTGNVWLCSAMHILNNTTSVLLLNIYGREANDMQFTGLLGSTSAVWGCIIACTISCLCLLHVFSKLLQVHSTKDRK